MSCLESVIDCAYVVVARHCMSCNCTPRDDKLFEVLRQLEGASSLAGEDALPVDSETEAASSVSAQ